MSLDHINSKKIRKSFGKIPLVTSLPNLVEVQKRSFDNFLQLRTDPDKRENVGLHSIFKSVFPIHDYTERTSQYLENKCDRNFKLSWSIKIS